MTCEHLTVVCLRTRDSVRWECVDCGVAFHPQATVDVLRKGIMNQRGDDLCWIQDPATARALPEAEFMESCRRYRAQIASERGEFAEGKTIAQLEAEIVCLKEALEKTPELLRCGHPIKHSETGACGVSGCVNEFQQE